MADEEAQTGIELYNRTVTYSENSVVLAITNGVAKVYQSLANNNTSALTDTTKWKEILADIDLSNLSSSGADKFVTDSTTQTISAVKTFSVSPIVPTPVGNTDCANKKYVDDIVGDLTNI